MSELPVRPDDLRELAGFSASSIAADPYPAYARWRAERPVARPRERLYVLSRFADCEAVLGDPAFGRAEEDDALAGTGQARAAARGRRTGDGVSAVDAGGSTRRTTPGCLLLSPGRPA